MSNAQLSWITGASGFIGRHLALRLSAVGMNVAGLGHGAWPERSAEETGVRDWLNASVLFSNLEVLKKRTGSPNVVFHLAGGSSVGAAIANPAEDFRRTVTSTLELLEWVRRESPETVVVAVSSAAVYGDGHRDLIREDAELNPFSPYGYHKFMMETLCRSYGSADGTQSVIARLFSVYGRGLRKQLLWDLCGKLTRADASVMLGGTGKELRDWIDVRDAVAALSVLPPLASAQVTAVNVATGHGTPVSEIAEIVRSAWPNPPPVIFSGESRAGDPFSLVADCSKLTSLGFERSHPVSQGISEYVGWFRTYDRTDRSA